MGYAGERHPGVRQRLSCLQPAQTISSGNWPLATSVCAPSALVSHLFGLCCLPLSNKHTAILTVVDRFSKMAHFVTLPKLPSAKETAELVLLHVFQLHGLLRRGLSLRW